MGCGTKTIETGRLILRRFTLADAADMFYGWAGDDEVTKHMAWKTHVSEEDSKEYISFVLNNYERNEDCYEWAVELKENGKAVGSIGCVNINKNIESAETGYCLSKKYWGKGIMAEALEAVIKYMFKDAQANRIEAHHFLANTASGRVMQKCGMSFEGIKRSGGRDNKGNLADVAVYAVIKSDYFRRKK